MRSRGRNRPGARDFAGRQTHVGAIEAQVDAADHCPHVQLVEIGIGVGRAGLDAVEAGLDGFCERGHIDIRLAGVGLG